MIAGFSAVCYACIWMVYFSMEPAVFSYDCWFQCSLLFISGWCVSVWNQQCLVMIAGFSAVCCLYLDGVFQYGTSTSI